ncbi:replicative DNA helicase [Rothia sp. SD9660Na]|uniref:replicative DNA helicase n=1 Tax=Rothia sp. SD9660Na TaxID=3047030 RepID=UPI0024BB4202|nr:replicative DNA helicase [Rothia sp. SD9660Na]WHS50394.1 replicative DNA helicase [Rothia sp. SD9660Na]
MIEPHHILHYRGAALSESQSEFVRTPPHDDTAEQSVLGGMMLSKDAIADVVEVIGGGADFYKPAHEMIYEAIIHLYGHGEPADAITVADELTKRGELNRVGGAAYLHSLIAGVPTAANAGFYAEIVAERAMLRRLVEAGTKIVQLGYSGDGEAEALVNAAQAEIYGVSANNTKEDYVPLSEAMNSTVEEIEANGSRDGGVHGVPTGFIEFDELTAGLQAGQMIVIAARPAMGKALALDTPIPTPTGWTTMGDIRVGDTVLGADGHPTTVTNATDVMTGRPCFKVIFDDGTEIIADAEHQWLTETRASRRARSSALAGSGGGRVRTSVGAQVRTTAEIRETVCCATADRRANHSIANTRPLQLPEADLLVTPYTLGIWLGDDSTILAPSAESLRTLGVLNNKHIPMQYLRASEAQRRALLAGLLDSDGTVTNAGCIQFTVTNRQLALDTQELALSLGYRMGMATKKVKGSSEATSTAYKLTFSSSDSVFALSRKKQMHRDRDSRPTAKRSSRYIVAVEPVDSVPVRCIEVDNEQHLFLASRAFVPTHNSTFALDIARSAAIKHGMTTVFFSLEMGRNEIAMKILSAEAGINLSDLRKGKLDDDQWAKIATAMGKMDSAPLFIDDSPNMTLMEIRAKARRLKQKNNLKLIVLDYLQLMSSGKKVESRQQEVSEFSRALKLMAKELEVPLIALSQLNRGSEQRTDKKPQVSDLRESGCLTADTRVLRSDTGAETTMGELFEQGAQDVPVWSLGDDMRFVERHLIHVFSTGVKPVYRLTLASGKTLRATANHPFFTYTGWKGLGELAVGDRLGVPRHVNGPSARTHWSDEQVIETASTAPVLGVPSEVFSLPKEQIRLFLRSVFLDVQTVDSSVTVNLPRPVAEQVSLLLLRFGISTVVEDGSLCVAESDDLVRFSFEIQEIEIPDAGVPLGRNEQVWGQVGDVLSEPTRVADALTSAGVRTSAPVLTQVASVLDAAELDMLAVNDLFWDTVTSIEYEGEEEVFDATVLGNHNFIANGITVHNSIEQDADMVILLHREDYYEKESTRAGEADVIVAKHRNGPTKTIAVAFQGHYSRFANMVHDSYTGTETF